MQEYYICFDAEVQYHWRFRIRHYAKAWAYTQADNKNVMLIYPAVEEILLAERRKGHKLL